VGGALCPDVRGIGQIGATISIRRGVKPLPQNQLPSGLSEASYNNTSPAYYLRVYVAFFRDSFLRPLFERGWVTP
jgi:hypothetical protein